MRREKALGFSGCDSRPPPPEEARSRGEELERSVEVTTLPKPLVWSVLQGLAKGGNMAGEVMLTSARRDV